MGHHLERNSAEQREPEARRRAEQRMGDEKVGQREDLLSKEEKKIFEDPWGTRGSLQGRLLTHMFV